MIYLKVPASTSNLGPGFDSIGMALNLYLEIEAERSDEWQFTHHGEQLQSLPNDASHYIAVMSRYFCDYFHVQPIKLKIDMKSDIPLARGLGSSGSALIASLLLVDYYHHLNLTAEEMISCLTKIEGHPDNVVPSLLGGLVTGYFDGEHCHYIELPPIEWPLYVVIPNYELKTSDARNVLPKQLEFKSAVEASAISNVLTAALSVRNYELAGSMMMKDLLHEPYRKSLIQDYAEVKRIIEGHGYCFLSGAGPTLFIMLKPSHEKAIESLIQQLPETDVLPVKVDTIGYIRQELL